MKSEMSEIKTNLKIKWREEGPALEDQKCVSDQDKQEVLLLGWVSQQVPTFLGEKTPRVPPSSRMATPISANKASLEKQQAHQNTNTKMSIKSVSCELESKACKAKTIVCVSNANVKNLSIPSFMRI